MLHPRSWPCEDISLVFGDMQDVGNHRRPAFFQHTQYFGERLFTTLSVFDVMNRKTARDYVETLVAERQSSLVGRMQFDTATDTFKLGIAPRRLTDRWWTKDRRRSHAPPAGALQQG